MKTYSGKAYFLFITAFFASVLFLASCGGTDSKQEAYGIAQDCKLFIKSKVKVKKPYGAVFSLPLPEKGLTNVVALFYWNEEGPFKIPLGHHEVRENEQSGKKIAFLGFGLFTGRAGTYNISGELIYQDMTTGKMMRSPRISAGMITVEE